MINYYCRYCGAEAIIYKQRECHDIHTGELDGHFISLKCTAHPWLHRYLEYERESNE